MENTTTYRTEIITEISTSVTLVRYYGEGLKTLVRMTATSIVQSWDRETTAMVITMAGDGLALAREMGAGSVMDRTRCEYESIVEKRLPDGVSVEWQWSDVMTPTAPYSKDGVPIATCADQCVADATQAILWQLLGWGGTVVDGWRMPVSRRIPTPIAPTPEMSTIYDPDDD